ncbi:hypothetical protein PTKU15_62990 [Paraburkholderia terrae]|nr:hypothetical protein PTKU15_62990 [Paraburkholderia terrae]
MTANGWAPEGTNEGGVASAAFAAKGDIKTTQPSAARYTICCASMHIARMTLLEYERKGNMIAIRLEEYR